MTGVRFAVTESLDVCRGDRGDFPDRVADVVKAKMGSVVHLFWCSLKQFTRRYTAKAKRIPAG